MSGNSHYELVGNCPMCGNPIYMPDYWENGAIPIPQRTCNCIDKRAFFDDPDGYVSTISTKDSNR